MTAELWARRTSGADYLDAVRMIEAAPAHVAAALHARYVATAGESRSFWSDGAGRVLDSFNAAFAELRATHGKLREARLPLAFDEEEIKARAHYAAEICAHAPTLAAAIEYASTYGIELPRGRRVTDESRFARLKSPRFWRRRLRAILARRAEDVLRSLGFVHAHASSYVTADGRRRFANQKAAGRRFLEAHDVACEQTGELFPLDAVADKTVSNPAIRRGELMVRARGFEECAAARGDVAVFFTLTCPSAFHAVKRDGTRNALWNGATPREGQRWLNKQWARARAKLARLSLAFYGFRVAEPHHDATPHWHALLFCRPCDARTIEAVLRGVWLAEHAEEVGAAEHRVKVQAIDAAKGPAVGYLAKYVSKNIDGAGAIGDAASDEHAGAVCVTVEAVEAWARIHGIRQFQQLGGPSVVLWRELRRIREPVEVEAIEAARAATDRTDAGGASWSRFIAALGGIEECRERSRDMLEKAPPRKRDAQGRDVLRLTEWGELPAERPVGVKAVQLCGDVKVPRIKRIATRVLTWVRVLRSSVRSALGPVAITVRGDTAPHGEVDLWKLETTPAPA